MRMQLAVSEASKFPPELLPPPPGSDKVDDAAGLALESAGRKLEFVVELQPGALKVTSNWPLSRLGELSTSHSRELFCLRRTVALSAISDQTRINFFNSIYANQ